MKKEKEIPLKNYIILSLVLIITIIIVIYLFMWHSTYEKNKLQVPILDSYLMVINYNELDNYLVENKDAIIYATVLNNIEIRNFEVKFRNLIEKNSLNNNILYLDLTEELSNSSTKEILKAKYNSEITEVPSIIIFKDGVVKDIYNIKKTNYNIKTLEDYLRKEAIIND